MQITIDIPEEFVSEYKDDKFGDSLQRLKSDAHLLAGNYEKELIDMLIKAFKNANEDDTPKLPKPPHPRWEPKEIENYCVIMSDGTSDTRISRASTDDGIFIGRYSIGNVFKTEEAAGFVIERLKVLAEMREWAGNWDDGVALKYDGTNKLISPIFISPRQYTFGEMRFESQGDARKCIDAVGEDRIKRYYFMISE